jgi:hypothetical protein
MGGGAGGIYTKSLAGSARWTRVLVESIGRDHNCPMVRVPYTKILAFVPTIIISFQRLGRSGCRGRKALPTSCWPDKRARRSAVGALGVQQLVARTRGLTSLSGLFPLPAAPWCHRRMVAETVSKRYLSQCDNTARVLRSIHQRSIL